MRKTQLAMASFEDGRRPRAKECKSKTNSPVEPPEASARSKFYVREPLHDKPDWLKVGFALGTSAFMWICLIKQHNEDVLEYERRNGLA